MRKKSLIDDNIDTDSNNTVSTTNNTATATTTTSTTISTTNNTATVTNNTTATDTTSNDKMSHFSDKYKINNIVGSGSFAVVYNGTNIITLEEVAIKIINKSNVISDDDKNNIINEVNILSSIDHQNIIKIIDFYDEENYYYIILELAHGGELFDRIINKEYYNENDAKNVINIIINAIDYCHDKDIVHRDLKPENLLLLSNDNDTNLKIADFGFATRCHNHDHSLIEYIGTPGYLAPELLEHHNYGKEVDMWSVGIITFILLCGITLLSSSSLLLLSSSSSSLLLSSLGYPPFGQDSKEKIIHANFHFNEKYWKNVSNDAKDFIKSLLTVDIDARLTSKQALNHTWLTQSISSSSLDNLNTLEELRHYQKIKKLRIAVTVGLAVNKLKHHHHHENEHDKSDKNDDDHDKKESDKHNENKNDDNEHNNMESSKRRKV